MNICKVENCNNKVYGHGLCSKHYNRWYRYGDVNIVHESKRHPTHGHCVGGKYSSEYETYKAMKKRCYKKKLLQNTT